MNTLSCNCNFRNAWMPQVLLEVCHCKMTFILYEKFFGFFFLTQVFSFVGHFPSNRFFSRHTHLLEASNVCLSIEAIAPKKYDLNKLNNWLFYAWPNRLNHCAPKTDDNERKRKNGTRKHGKDCAPGRDKKVEVQCAFVHFMYFVVQSSYLMHSL